MLARRHWFQQLRVGRAGSRRFSAPAPGSVVAGPAAIDVGHRVDLVLADGLDHVARATPASGRRSAGDDRGDRRARRGCVMPLMPERAVRRVAVRSRDRRRPRARSRSAPRRSSGLSPTGARTMPVDVARSIDERAARRRPARRGRGLDEPARGRAVGDGDEAVGRGDEPAAHPRRRSPGVGAPTTHTVSPAFGRATRRGAGTPSAFGTMVDPSLGAASREQHEIGRRVAADDCAPCTAPSAVVTFTWSAAPMSRSLVRISPDWRMHTPEPRRLVRPRRARSPRRRSARRRPRAPAPS